MVSHFLLCIFPIEKPTCNRSAFCLRSKAEILSKIELARNRTLGNRLAVPLEEEFALAEEVNAVDDVEGLADVVIRDEDAHAALTQILDDLLYVGDGERINARKRLVEQDELRLKRKAARDLDAAEQGI